MTGRLAAMLRTLATPRWIGFTVLALMAIAVCFAASVWQWQRTQGQLDLERAAVAREADYTEVVTGADLPLSALGRAVRVTGTPLPRARSAVRSRVDGSGRVGYLIVDGLRLADGRVVAVLQGWVRRPDAAPDPQSSPLTVSGRVQPDENFYRDAPISAAEPLVTITGAGLNAQWEPQLDAVAADLAPGYVTLTSPSARFERSPPVFGADPDVPFPLQNAFYTVQWLIFAVLVVFVWVRGLFLDVRRRSRPEPRDPHYTSAGSAPR